MRLSELIDGTAAGRDPSAGGVCDPDVRGITSDSRAVQPGYLFAALPGARADGRCFIPDAVARGAVAVLARPAAVQSDPDPGICMIRDANPRRRLALVAARFYGRQPETAVAVTGTNGKTSVVEFTRQFWTGLGVSGASLGTLGTVTPAGRSGPGLTTPDPVALQAMLSDLAAAGVTHLALEASSHGLDQFRLDGVRLAAAAFTNLTREHLDYHRTMPRYFAAKRRLFAELLGADGVAVLNHDEAGYERLAETCRARGIRIVTFGTGAAADLALVHQRPVADGQRVTLRLDGREHTVGLPLAGVFQASNILAAMALVAAANHCSHADLLDCFASLRGVPGRLQQVAAHPSGAAVFVDYAHTPDALRTMLAALRPHVPGRLVCVFGAGGDRDREKRVLMGQAVAAAADDAIVTDDNPRGEPACMIRQAVLRGCPEAREIGDRASAIAAGLAGLRSGDALVIAGKGHEQGQIVGAEVRPFDDAQIARAAAAALGGEPV